ncbi:MAG TPA: hypothetical protein VHY56_00520 [Candidatus Binataceae bacterium]|nr:hypothetical protein [Candidatus Binataceae bacterium]
MAALLLNLLLLRIDLRLSLSVGVLLILHRIADDETGACTKRATDGGASAWRTDRGTDYGAGACTDQRADTSAFFARAERLTGASGKRHEHRESKQARD